MIHKAKYISMVLVLIVIILFFIFYIKSNKPADVIKSKINLQLPSDSIISHFSSVKFTGNLDAKVQIEKQDVESINKQLLEIFIQEYEIHNDSYILSMGHTIPWWNIKKDDVQACYSGATDGERFLFFPSAKTQQIWALITNENDEYFLYITSH